MKDWQKRLHQLIQQKDSRTHGNSRATAKAKETEQELLREQKMYLFPHPGWIAARAKKIRISRSLDLLVVF